MSAFSASLVAKKPAEEETQVDRSADPFDNACPLPDEIDRAAEKLRVEELAEKTWADIPIPHNEEYLPTIMAEELDMLVYEEWSSVFNWVSLEGKTVAAS